MQGNGRGQVSNNDRQQIIEALEDTRYDWRTVEGLSDQTGIPVQTVRDILEGLQQDVVRSSIPDELGRSLYTTRRHYRQTQSLGTQILSALSDRIT